MFVSMKYSSTCVGVSFVFNMSKPNASNMCFTFRPLFFRTAVPCPLGYAQGVCPNNMNCIAETQCASETCLQYLRDKQANNGSGKDFVQSKPSPPTGSVVPAVTATMPPPEIVTTLDNNISISNGSNPLNQPPNPPSMNVSFTNFCLSIPYTLG